MEFCLILKHLNRVGRGTVIVKSASKILFHKRVIYLFEQNFFAKIHEAELFIIFQVILSLKNAKTFIFDLFLSDSDFPLGLFSAHE